MGMFSRLGNDLYTGKKSIDFVGRKWLWYCGSGLIVLLAVCGLYFQGLNMASSSRAARSTASPCRRTR